MTANPKYYLTDHFRKGTGCRVIPDDEDGDGDFSMSEREFQKFHQNFHFPIQLFSLFNDKFCPLVCDYYYY